MDPKRFYSIKTIAISEFKLQHVNLSNDDFYRKRTRFSQVLVEDTSEEEQFDREVIWDDIVEESDFYDSKKG